MPRDLEAAVSTHKALAEQVRQAFPAEDEADLADTIEGLSTIDEAIFAVLRAALERETMAKALGEMIEGMASRKGRLMAGAQSMRAAALHAMNECGLKKLQAPDMTVSVGIGKAKLIVTDEKAVPDFLSRTIREPDKAAINERYKDSAELPSWLVRGNPAPSLRITRK